MAVTDRQTTNALFYVTEAWLIRHQSLAAIIDLVKDYIYVLQLIELAG